MASLEMFVWIVDIYFEYNYPQIIALHVSVDTTEIFSFVPSIKLKWTNNTVATSFICQIKIEDRFKKPTLFMFVSRNGRVLA